MPVELPESRFGLVAPWVRTIWVVEKSFATFLASPSSELKGCLEDASWEKCRSDTLVYLWVVWSLYLFLSGGTTLKGNSIVIQTRRNKGVIGHWCFTVLGRVCIFLILGGLSLPTPCVGVGVSSGVYWWFTGAGLRHRDATKVFKRKFTGTPPRMGQNELTMM